MRKLSFSPKLKKLVASLKTRFGSKGSKKRAARVRLHRSFRRSYREDYLRELEVPGLLYHAMDSFRIIFKNWRLFLPLILIAVFFYATAVGVMSEETYVKFQDVLEETGTKVNYSNVSNFVKSGLLLVSTVTTGGLNSGLSDVEVVFAVLAFLIIWLVTIYLLRFRLAEKKVRLRDAFYNALTPLLSTLVVFFVGFLQAFPIFIVIFTYSMAVQTDFLSTPFYALVFFIFAASLLLLSAYLLSSTLMALVATSAPGLYPLAALRSANDLVAGRRTRFVIRLIYLALVVGLYWVIIMLPLIALDLFLKSHLSWLTGVPFIPFCLLIMTCFTFVYITTYLYLYYRRSLSYENTH